MARELSSLVVAIALAALTACASTARAPQDAATPSVTPFSTSYPLEAATLASARAESGLALPSNELTGSWRVVRVAYSPTDPLRAVHITYESAGSRLLVVVDPANMVRLDLAGLRTREVTASGTTGTMVWGHRLVAAPPSGHSFDPTSADSPLRLIFEHRGALVTIVSSPPLVAEDELVAFMAEWVAEAK